MHGPAESAGGPLRGVRILAVEDDYLVLLEIATVLSEAGAVVVKCTTVNQALQAIEAERPAAAVLDVRMGRATIAPVARKLTDLDMPFVFYTGQVTAEPAMSQWPGARVISKPAPPRVLVDTITELLKDAETRARGR